MKSLRTLGAAIRGVFVVIGLAVVVGAGAYLFGKLSFESPFQESTVERPQAVLLTDLQDVARFTAATGRMQTIVDVEHDTSYVPDFIKGERAVLTAEGDVDAVVDFATLPGSAIQTSADGKHVTITLPEPELTAPRLDHDHTRVVTRDRGVLDRVEDAVTSGSPSDDQWLYQRATEKLAEAAEQSELRERAKRNTDTFVTSLVDHLGLDSVTVVFEPPAPDPQAAVA